MRREAAFHSTFRHYLAARMPQTCAVEVKQTTKDSIPFRLVEEHQKESLLAAKHRTLTYKPPDDTRGFKPCDFLHLAGVPAYIVIKYPLGFVMIDIDDWVLEEKDSTRRSLTWKRALNIATIIEEKSHK